MWISATPNDDIKWGCPKMETPQALHAHGGAVPDGPESAGGALTGSERGSSPGKNGGIQHDLTGKHGIYRGKWGGFSRW